MLIIRATDLEDARRQISYRLPRIDIAIKFRQGLDFGRIPVKGAIVEFKAKDSLPLEFQTAEDAIVYISSILKEHDSKVEDFESSTRSTTTGSCTNP